MYDENIFNNLDDMQAILQESYQELNKFKYPQDILPQDVESLQYNLVKVMQQVKDVRNASLEMSRKVSKYQTFKNPSQKSIAKVRQCMLGTYNALLPILDKYGSKVEYVNKFYNDPYGSIDRYDGYTVTSIPVTEARDKLNLIMKNYKDNMQFVIDYINEDDKTAYPINQADVYDWLDRFKKMTFSLCEDFEYYLKPQDRFDSQSLLQNFDYTLRETDMNMMHVVGLTDEYDEWELTFGE